MPSLILVLLFLELFEYGDSLNFFSVRRDTELGVRQRVEDVDLSFSASLPHRSSLRCQSVFIETVLNFSHNLNVFVFHHAVGTGFLRRLDAGVGTTAPV